MNYKALVFGIEGTIIVAAERMPSEGIKETIIELQKYKNIHIAAATIKPFKHIKGLCKDLRLSEYAIVSGGAQLVNLKTETFYYELPLDLSQTLTLCKLIKALYKDVHIWIQDNGTYYIFNEFYQPSKPFVIVVYAMPEKFADDILNKLSHLSGFFYTKEFSGEKGFFDIHITHEKANKEHGIKTLMHIWGISKENIVGIGDGYNDYPLLQASGLKIAMGNAVKEVKEIADDVVPSVEDDGLAIAIQTYLLDNAKE